MDRMYRYQRHFYDLTRKYYLIGRDRLLREMPIDGADRVLEVGCGTGRNLIKLARVYRGARFYGLDASEEMLKTGRSKIARSDISDRITLRQALAEDWTHEGTFGLEEPLDQIFFSYSLSMIPQWRAAIDNAFANLKPDGNLFILDFGDGQDLPDWFKGGLTKWLDLFGVHHRPELISYLTERRGSRKLELTTIGRRYSYIIHARKS
jgi:S-adenosylmethionine-diacylgycerolhomoserine-N-methlytransferase